MKEEAKLTLEYVVQEIDKTAVFPAGHDSWKEQVEQTTLTPEDVHSRHVELTLLMAMLAGAEQAIVKILVGENRLTPSLVSRGWRFWEEPLLTQKEKKAVELAVVKWCNSKAAQNKLLHDTHENLSNIDTRTYVILLASVLDMTYSSMQQLSADLKEVLLSAQT